MTDLLWPSLALAIAFFTVASIDAYYHLWRYRLFARPESLGEHVTHTVQAWIAVPTIWLLYGISSNGLLLYTAVALVVVHLVVELIDMRLEWGSRASIGGLTTAEYVVHVVSTRLHTGALTLAFASRPASAWALEGPLVGEPLPGGVALVGRALLPGAVLVAVVHAALLHPRFRVRRFDSPGHAD